MNATKPDDGSVTISSPALVGISLGACILFLLLLVFCVVTCTRSHSTDNEEEPDEDELERGGQNKFIATQDHYPATKEEIKINVNDTIYVIGSAGEGWSRGVNTRTREAGIFPSAVIGSATQRQSMQFVIKY